MTEELLKQILVYDMALKMFAMSIKRRKSGLAVSDDKFEQVYILILENEGVVAIAVTGGARAGILDVKFVESDIWTQDICTVLAGHDGSYCFQWGEVELSKIWWCIVVVCLCGGRAFCHVCQSPMPILGLDVDGLIQECKEMCVKVIDIQVEKGKDEL